MDEVHNLQKHRSIQPAAIKCEEKKFIYISQYGVKIQRIGGCRLEALLSDCNGLVFAADLKSIIDCSENNRF